MKRSRPWISAAVGAIATLVVLLPPAGPWVSGLSQDVSFLLRHAVFGPRWQASQSPTAIIAIDEETYRRPPFAGTPKVLWTPYLGEVLQAVLDAGATVVGQDLILPTSAQSVVPGYDKPYLQALKSGRANGRIVLAEAAHNRDPLSPHRLHALIAGGSANIRLVNLHTDPDGVVRSVPATFERPRPDGASIEQPSFALELAARSAGVAVNRDGAAPLRFGDRRLASDAGGNLQVNFVGGGGALPVYSLADLYACAQEGRREFFERAFAGRPVVVGSVLDIEDRNATSMRFVTAPDHVSFAERCVHPVMESYYDNATTRTSLPGAFIHAQLVNDILRDDLLRPLAGGERSALVLVVATLAAAAVLYLGLGWSLGALVLGLALWIPGVTAAFADGVILPLLDAPLAGVLAAGGGLGYRYWASERAGRHIRQSFESYVSEEVVRELVDSGRIPALGGETREVTIWFSDLQGFTTRAETLPPDQLLDCLNRYLATVSDIVVAHRGMVDKYIGDAVVAIFGAPADDPNHADNAVAAAVACQRRLDQLGHELAFGPDGPLRTRIGLNSGRALVGNVGSAKRMNYTVLGDAVNLAARLEGANKRYATRILLSEATRQACSSPPPLRAIDVVRVRGRAQPTRIYEPAPDATPRDLEVFAAARRAFEAGRFEEAAAAFRALAGNDPVAARLAEQAEHLAAAPPADWDGAQRLD